MRDDIGNIRDDIGNRAESAPSRPAKHSSISERLRKAKSADTKKKVAQEWANEWKYEQTQIIMRLKKALETGHGVFLHKALEELEAITAKRHGVLPRVIALLLDDE